jgi:hypothetical protein
MPTAITTTTTRIPRIVRTGEEPVWVDPAVRSVPSDATEPRIGRFGACT